MNTAVARADDIAGIIIREDLSPLKPKQLERHIGLRASCPDHHLRGPHQRLPVFLHAEAPRLDLAQLSALRSEWSQRPSGSCS